MRNSQHSVSLGTFGLAFAIVLSPAFMQSGLTFTSCKTGDTRLSELVVEVSGQDQVTSFDPDLRIYDVWLWSGVDSAVVRVIPMDAGSQVWVNYYSDAGGVGLMLAQVGGGEVTVDLDPGESSLWIYVKAPGGASDTYEVAVHVGCSDCDDQSDCTADSCNSAPELCVHTAAPDGSACDFGDVPGICEGGTCASLCSVVECDDGNDCTTDTCAIGTGECTNAPLDGVPCDGGACQSGACALSGSVLPCTEQGIRNAIAAGVGPYTFDCVGPTTVVTTDTIVIDNDVILDGEGNFTVDGNDDHGVFVVSPGATVELRGLVVTRGRGPLGGGIDNGGLLILADSKVMDNAAPDDSVCVEQSCRTHCTPFGCDYICNCVAYSGSGGGIHNTGMLKIASSTVSANSAITSGGGIHSSGTLTIVDSTISANSSATGTGGGIHSDGTLGIANSTLSGNTPNAINNSGTLTILNSSFSANEDLSGNCGAAIVDRGQATIADSEIVGNIGVCAAVSNMGSTLELVRSTVSGNDGGGLYNSTNNVMSVADSTVSGNIVGGGIVNFGRLTVTNSTVSGNDSSASTTFPHGGIYNKHTGGTGTNKGVLELINSTISGNVGKVDWSVFGVYSGLYNEDGLVTVKGSIIDGMCLGPTGPTSVGYNVESPYSTCVFDQPTDQSSVTLAELNLGPLTDNGGPTMTRALLPGSVAIDTIPVAMCQVSKDQRGVTRPQGLACDVGAFELEQ